MNDQELRRAVISACQEISVRGLTHGTSGNVSVRRDAESFFISPSGLAYEGLAATDIPLVTIAGTWFGKRKPSSEWRFHRDVLAARPEIGAIVHTHSRYAVGLACTGRGIPAFHYMVAVAGGADIKCAPYATFGSQDLSDYAVQALEGRKACLLANHGVIALGGNASEAVALAGEVENLAAQYSAALQAGEPVLLDSAEMARVLEKFKTYGRQEGAEDALAFGGESVPSQASKS